MMLDVDSDVLNGPQIPDFLNARPGTPTAVLWFYTTLNIDMKNQICEEY
jgi:hypothetical protein